MNAIFIAKSVKVSWKLICEIAEYYIPNQGFQDTASDSRFARRQEDFECHALVPAEVLRLKETLVSQNLIIFIILIKHPFFLQEMAVASIHR